MRQVSRLFWPYEMRQRISFSIFSKIIPLFYFIFFFVVCSPSQVAVSRGQFCRSAWAVHCRSFSHCGAQARGAQALVVAARRLRSCGSWAQFSVTCAIFPDQGSNSMFSALARGILIQWTTRKVLTFILNITSSLIAQKNLPQFCLLKVVFHQLRYCTI